MQRAIWKLRRCVTLLALACILYGSPLFANVSLYKRCLRSTAWVVVPKGTGTATLINESERILLTNYHVVGEENNPIVFFPVYKANDVITDFKYYLDNAKSVGVKGKVIARSKGCDLALIKVERVPSGQVELPLAQRSPSPGETLYAIGNSGLKTGSLWRFSKGEVRQVFLRKFKTGSAADPSSAFEVNAKIVETQIPINPGDSGGPVMNTRGELNAVTQGYQADQSLVTTMIDITEVRAFLKKENLLSKKK